MRAPLGGVMRGLLVPWIERPKRAHADKRHGLLYVDRLTGRFRGMRPDGTDVGIERPETSALGSGTASSTTFLRGDRTWATPTASFSGTLWGSADDIDTILATSSNGHYERHPDRPSLIIAKARQWAAVADAKANPPALWTLGHSARFTSATIASNRLSAVMTGTGEHYNGTDTAGRYHRSFLLPDGTYEIVFRLDLQTVGSLSSVRLALESTLARIGMGVDVRNNAGTYEIHWLANDTGTDTTLTTATLAQMQAGIWFRLRLVRQLYWVDYNKTLGGTTAPTEAQWTVGARTVMSTGTNTLTVTPWLLVIAFTTPTGNALEGGVILASERVYAGLGNYAPLLGDGMATTGDTLTLLGSVNFGAARLPTVAVVRAMLGAAINKLPGDAATWKFGVVGGSSASLTAPTTLQTASTLDLKQSGSDTAADAGGHQYWAIFARAESSGNTQPGSLDLSQIRLRAAA